MGSRFLVVYSKRDTNCTDLVSLHGANRESESAINRGETYEEGLACVPNLLICLYKELSLLKLQPWNYSNHWPGCQMERDLPPYSPRGTGNPLFNCSHRMETRLARPGSYLHLFGHSIHSLSKYPIADLLTISEITLPVPQCSNLHLLFVMPAQCYMIDPSRPLSIAN